MHWEPKTPIQKQIDIQYGDVLYINKTTASLSARTAHVFSLFDTYSKLSRYN